MYVCSIFHFRWVYFWNSHCHLIFFFVYCLFFYFDSRNNFNCVYIYLIFLRPLFLFFLQTMISWETQLYFLLFLLSNLLSLTKENEIKMENRAKWEKKLNEVSILYGKLRSTEFLTIPSKKNILSLFFIRLCFSRVPSVFLLHTYLNIRHCIFVLWNLIIILLSATLFV